MTGSRDLEHRIADYCATEAPQRAPNRVLESVLATSEITRQRRAVIRLPWRFPRMNSYAKLAIAAVAVIAIGAVGLAVLRPGTSPSVGGPASPSPSDGPSPSLLLPLNETFSSPTNAIAVSYSTGWRVEPATTEWTTGIPLQGDSFRDLISDPLRENTFLLIASQRLGMRRGEEFMADTAAAPAWGDGACQPTTDYAPLNGISATLVRLCDGSLTAVASYGERGYLIVVFGIDDLAWFRDILASAQMG